MGISVGGGGVSVLGMVVQVGGGGRSVLVGSGVEGDEQLENRNKLVHETRSVKGIQILFIIPPSYMQCSNKNTADEFSGVTGMPFYLSDS
jgi:hypothetical protein